MRIKHFLSLFLFFLFAIYITYPLIFHLQDFATGTGDELVIAWIQSWVIHSLQTGNLQSLFNANVYYPFPNSFAYSDLLLTSSILSFIPVQVLKEPVVATNFTFLTSLTLLGFSVYLLGWYLTRDVLASLLSGLLIVFSPAVLDKATHLQILTIYWVPLAILFFLIFLRTKQTKYFVFTLLSFLLQTYNSILPGFFIVFSLVIILIFQFFWDRKLALKLVTKKHLLLLALSLLLFVPIIIPYYQVSATFHYVRDLRDTIHFALQPEDFLYPGTTTRLHDTLLHIPFVNQTSSVGELKPGYLGFIFTVLAIGSFVLFFFRKKALRQKAQLRNFSLFLTIALTGLILSLGPFLHVNRQTIHHPFPISLPYLAFYYLIPGFQAVRDSERWEMLFILAIAVCIAIVFAQVLRKTTVVKKLLIYIPLFLLIVAEFQFPLHFEKVPQRQRFPQVYSWLQTTPAESAIIFEPIFNWNMWPYTQEEIWREYENTIAFRKTVNGYSGFSPLPWQDIVNYQFTNFPSEKSLAELKRLKISYIIVDKDLYNKLYKDKKTKEDGAHVIERLKINSSVKLVKQFGETYVFRLL